MLLLASARKKLNKIINCHAEIWHSNPLILHLKKTKVFNNRTNVIEFDYFCCFNNLLFN